MKTRQEFHRFAWFLFIYTLFVILWGAWVRISHSGDGCGASWPLCKGVLIPEAEQKKTWVEFSHRLTSGLFGFLVAGLFWRGRRFFAPRTPGRRALAATAVFTVTEALLGAKLVLFGLVGADDSLFRVFALGLHQVNSLLLSGSIALVVFFSGDLAPAATAKKSPQSSQGRLFLVLFVAIAVTGALASLASTLFPSTSLFEGLSQDFSPQAHYLVRLRIFHPLLATVLGGGTALYFWWKAQEEPDPEIKKAELQVAGILGGGVLLGYLTLFTLAPVVLKLGHLLLAHLIWVSLLKWYLLKKALLPR